MSLRRKLEKRGYVLVDRERFERNGSLEQRLRHCLDSRQSQQVEIWQLTDRIQELEAEIEAHKRIEAKLAERAIERDLL